MADLTVVTTGGYSAGAADIGLETVAGGGDAFVNTGREIVIIENADASPTTVSAALQAVASNYAAAGTKSQTVAAGDYGIMGPFPTHRFNDSAGKVQLTYSNATSVSVAVIRFAEPFGV